MRRNAFARIVGVVTRRPLIVLTITALLAVGGAALALRLEPSAATETLVDRGSDSFQATERFKQDFGDEAVLVLVRGKLSNTVLTDDLGRLLSLEGCLGGNIPPADLRRELARHRRDPRRGLPPVCGEIAALKPAKVVFGPATFINTSVNEIVDEIGRRQQATQRQAEQAAEAARRLSKRRGDPPAEQERLAEAAFNAVSAQLVQQMIADGLRYGLSGIPRIDDPAFVARLVFGTTTDTPKSRFAYLFPSSNAAMVTIRLRPDLSDAERRRAIDLIRTATERANLPAPARRRVHRHRRARGERGPRRGRAGLDLRPARGRPARDGRHARAGVPDPPAAPAAPARARRRRDDLRRALPGRRRPHDGLDRRAAGADRPGGGLRDPVPGPLRRGGGPREDTDPGAAGRAGCFRLGRGCSHRRRGGRRPDDPERGDRHRGRVPGPAALARAHGARLRRAARRGHRAGAPLRAVRGLCRARPLRPRPARARPVKAQLAYAGGEGAGMARRPRVALARGRPHAPAPGARDRPRRGRGRPRARHPERGRLGRARARAAGPPGAARRQRAPGGDRRVGGDRRDGPRRRHHRREGDRLDDPLPGRRPARARLQAREALHPGAQPARAVPGPLPAGPVQHLGDAAGSDPRAPRRRAGLLLAGRRDARPHDGQPRLRDPPDAARPPGGGGRGHQATARPARGRGGERGGPARAGGRGKRRAGVALAPRPDPAGGAGRRAPRPPAGAPLVAGGGRAAHPDRARHGMVGRRAVPARPAAGLARGRPEPDVGHPGRARDRDLDRVQRPALVALPAGARRRRRPGAGDRADLRLDRGRGARLRRHRDRRASPR